MKTKETIAPIFITGSVRSGTTILNRAIRAAGIRGYDEGRFIDFMGLYLKLSDRRYNDQEKAHSVSADTMLKNIPQEEFNKSFCEWFVDQYIKYCRYDEVWVDKTPNLEFIYSMDVLSDLIPNSKFIIMKRRPMENIQSRMKKFPHLDFETHCKFWVEIMELLEEKIPLLSKDKYIVIDQYDVSTKPEETAEKVGIFLNMNYSQIEIMKNTFVKTRPESTGGSESSTKNLDEFDWTEEQKKMFKEICGPVVERFGWSLDSNYYNN